ncbi:MAG: exopolyphosphatase, partial [Burkholderiaceae bacterium]
MNDGTLLAAVDLGSNSFRLEIGRYDHGHIQRVEYLKEMVRQGGGLDEERNLS